MLFRSGPKFLPNEKAILHGGSRGLHRPGMRIIHECEGKRHHDGGEKNEKKTGDGFHSELDLLPIAFTRVPESAATSFTLWWEIFEPSSCPTSGTGQTRHCRPIRRIMVRGRGGCLPLSMLATRRVTPCLRPGWPGFAG